MLQLNRVFYNTFKLKSNQYNNTFQKALFKQYNFTTKNVIRIHQVSDAGIQTHDILIVSPLR